MNRIVALSLGKTRKSLIFLLAITGLIIVSLALSMPASSEEKGNPKKGKYLFKAKCKECHKTELADKTVTPITYTQAQWKRFFEKNKHKRKKDISDLFTPADLIDIQRFLIDHASDSDQPETCG